MQPFQFRLATLMRLRESWRDEKRGELAQALRADAALLDRLQELEGDLRQLRVNATHQSVGPINVDRLLDAQRYELLLRAEEQMAIAQRKLLAEEIERRRLVLVEADREVRVLEKMKETQAARHQAEEERREQAQLDEIALRPFAMGGRTAWEG
jgi:flagellar FliJ protein